VYRRRLEETGRLGTIQAGGAGTVVFWHFFDNREAQVIQSVVDDFQVSHPEIKVTVQKAQDDTKLRQAIAAGRGPDVALSYSTDVVGAFCSSGTWQDLASYVTRDAVDLSQLPDVVRSYTEYGGKRCSMPVLADAYGLYYNKKLLAAAGYTAPPKTMTELADMAKKLTQQNPDGTIKVAGFVPSFGFYENTPQTWGPSWGTKWLDDKGKSAIADDQGWQDLATFQKSLVDWYGSANLTKFTTGAGQEFSAPATSGCAAQSATQPAPRIAADVDCPARDHDHADVRLPGALRVHRVDLGDEQQPGAHR
jgi:multiple sugar transport system substrate-binding protein